MNEHWKKEFPWQGNASSDVDVAVIGGGPAGLSAAIRLRWLKTFPLVPVSVALINSGPLGGLAKMGNSILTGPSLAFPAGKLVERLAEDFNKWPVPVISNRVEAIDKEQDVFVITLEDGQKLKALSVIVATGMLDIRNLWQFWKKGVSATFGSRENLFSVLQKELSGSKSPIVLGGPHLLTMSKHIKKLQPKTRLFILRDQSTQNNEKQGLEVFIGRILQAWGEKDRLTGLQVSCNQQELTLKTDKLLVDFNSLELEHNLPIHGLPLTEEGFVKVDNQCCTKVSGLFAGGDSTGHPFAAVVAMGQGVQAAFSAYRFVYEKKYGDEPSLFAYYGDKRVSQGPEVVDFELRPDLRPDKLVFKAPLPEHEDLWLAINGKATIKELTQKLAMPEDQVVEVLKVLLKERAITFFAVSGD